MREELKRMLDEALLNDVATSRDLLFIYFCELTLPVCFGNTTNMFIGDHVLRKKVWFVLHHFSPIVGEKTFWHWLFLCVGVYTFGAS